MSFKTITEYNNTCLLISLSMIVLTILTPVHAENSTFDTQLEHVNILHDTDNMYFPKVEEQNYITCKTIIVEQLPARRIGWSGFGVDISRPINISKMECEGYDKLKGTVIRFEDEHGNFKGKCAFHFSEFKKLVYSCIDKNGKNNFTHVAEFDVVDKFDRYVFIPIWVNFVVYMMYNILTPPTKYYSIFYLFIVYMNYRFVCKYTEDEYNSYSVGSVFWFCILNPFYSKYQNMKTHTDDKKDNKDVKND